MGRPRKPTELLRLTGNPGKRPLNESEPKPRRAMPVCPPHLNEEAKAEWERTGEELYRMGVLTLADRGTLAAYCEAWSTWVYAIGMVKNYGHTLISKKNEQVYQSPYLAIKNRALAQMHSFGGELGLSPAARTRIKCDVVKEDKLAEFLTVRSG